MMYFKIFNEEDNHHGFQYKDGLNVDTNPFDAHGSCVPGGLYFTTIDYICDFFKYGDYIRVVEVPEDAQMVQDPSNYKWRADKLFLHPRKALSDVETWKWLIELGINVAGLIPGYRIHPIVWASEGGHLEIVDLLLGNGADYNVCDNAAIRCASERGHLKVIELLLKHGADCTAQNNYAIFWASLNGHLATVELLLKHGAACPLGEYNDAIYWATKRGHVAIVELLLKHSAKLP